MGLAGNIPVDAWKLRYLGGMKKDLEPSFPVTFWPQALVQMSALVTYVGFLAQTGWAPSVRQRIEDLEGAGGWSLPFFLWVAFVFLVGETTTRLAQRGAAALFPFFRPGFALFTFILAVPVLYVAFVGLECVLFFIMMGRYPLWEGVYFNQGFGLTFEADLGFVAVLALGELLRQLLYRQAIQRWHHERGLRLRPVATEE